MFRPIANRAFRCFPALILCALIPGFAKAAPEWADEPYEYVVLDQDIRATLTDFGRNMGIAVSLSDAVKGRVRGRINADSAGEFLNRLADANGLNWYFDGAVLHLSTAGEYATRAVPTGGLRSAELLDEMDRLKLADDRFDIRGGADVISVSGPPAYVEMVRDFVQTMQPPPAAPNRDHPSVRVYRGRVGSEEIAAVSPTPDPAADPGTQP